MIYFYLKSFCKCHHQCPQKPNPAIGPPRHQVKSRINEKIAQITYRTLLDHARFQTTVFTAQVISRMNILQNQKRQHKICRILFNTLFKLSPVSGCNPVLSLKFVLISFTCSGVCLQSTFPPSEICLRLTILY